MKDNESKKKFTFFYFADYKSLIIQLSNLIQWQIIVNPGKGGNILVVAAETVV
jgi:hypothetical protein